jgi:DNA-binding NarL/FixJ family response regulator
MQDEAHLIELISGNNSMQDLTEVISQQNGGKVQLNKQISDIIYHVKHYAKKPKLLSSKEKKVLKLIARDYTNQEIAKKLVLNEKSIDSCCKSLLKKTKTSSTEGLLKFAFANNLV